MDGFLIKTKNDPKVDFQTAVKRIYNEVAINEM